MSWSADVNSRQILSLLSQEKLDEIFDPWDFLTRKDVVFDRLQELEFLVALTYFRQKGRPRSPLRFNLGSHFAEPGSAVS